MTERKYESIDIAAKIDEQVEMIRDEVPLSLHAGHRGPIMSALDAIETLAESVRSDLFDGAEVDEAVKAALGDIRVETSDEQAGLATLVERVSAAADKVLGSTGSTRAESGTSFDERFAISAKSCGAGRSTATASHPAWPSRSGPTTRRRR